ncbi:hypothetical protein AWZ03_003436 [Drosophila navojoa]|uniref:SCP domain-containing protein n=2 Tax=Drosophila navojoa TaxID=7232 RepID=A0A484BQ88_DRONA|nr:hypothetical protein AWZ03_003436 [Drosophila navojoa]
MNILALRMLPALLLPLILQQGSAYNFCNDDRGYCAMAESKHFICRLHTELKPLNEYIKQVIAIPDTYRLRDRILAYHNEFRDSVASGELKNKYGENFPAASSMRELIWDLELAYMARLHVSTLSFRHTICRAVKRFPVIGENMSMVFIDGMHINLTTLLDSTLRAMFVEHQDCSPPISFVTKYNVATFRETLGHFAIMINDRVSRVGCAFVVARNCLKPMQKGYCYLMTCHYNYNNIVGSRVYKRGDPASDCKRWETSPSSRYLNLCANNGKIFRNKAQEDINYMDSIKNVK